MADFQVTDKTLLTSVDRAVDSFLVYDSSASSLKRTTVNNALDLTSHPVGVDDSQTLTLKTLTAPTISSPVLSGTVTGTYTIGGTPTFPSSVVTLTGSQTLTNKVLTSPTINNATITNPTLTTDTVSEYTAAAGVTIDGLLVKDSKLATNDSVVTSNITNGAVTDTKVAAGMPVQIVSTNYSAVATGTTTIPYDDTIPQNTEGTEFMTQAITPKSATNFLLIEVQAMLSLSAGLIHATGAIFQDTTAGALAAQAVYLDVATEVQVLKITHKMTAGTTSATTFKFRAGGQSASTTTFNGVSGARKFGGITISNITITEVKV